MQAREVFRAGMKVVGVIILLLSIKEIFFVVTFFWMPMNDKDAVPSEMLFIFRFQMFLRSLVPFIMAGIGIYFLKGGEHVVNFAYSSSSGNRRQQNRQEETEAAEEQPAGSDLLTAEALFMFIIKIIGILLMVYAFPRIIQLLAGLMFHREAESVRVPWPLAYDWSQILLMFFNLMIGFYLLKGGRMLQKMAFPPQE